MARLTTPILGTGTLRACQLLVLVVLTRLAPEGQRDVLVTAFGLLAGVGIISDSGAGNYLLTSEPRSLSRSSFRKVLAVHLGTTLTGSLIVLVAIISFGSNAGSGSAVGVIFALSFTQVLDSTIRVAKAPLLLEGLDGTYGAVDLVAAALKLPILGGAFVLSDVRAMYVLPIASLAVLTWLLPTVWGRIPRTSNSTPRRLVLRILEIGASGALTALYSQAPLFIGAATLSAPDAARLAAATRIVQSLEFVPSTLAIQAMPRLRRDGSQAPRWWAAMVVCGTVLATLVLLARNAIEQLLTLQLGPGLLLALLCTAFAVKCGNYILVAGLLSRSLAKVRLIISVVVGCISITLCVAASYSGLSAFAATALATELVLAAACATALRDRRQDPDHAG